MSFCGWSSGEKYKDHFADGMWNILLKLGARYMYILSYNAVYFNIRMSILSPLQAFTCVPSADTSCFTALLSSSTLHHGLPSQKPSDLTASLSMQSLPRP